MISITPGDPRPIFKQIVDGIKTQIVTAELRPGSKLPSVRALAMQLTINTNTVARAYSELASLGLVESRKGLGLFVAEPRQVLSSDERQRRLDAATQQYLHDVIGLNFSAQEIQQALQQKLDELYKRDSEDK